MNLRSTKSEQILIFTSVSAQWGDRLRNCAIRFAENELPVSKYITVPKYLLATWEAALRQTYKLIKISPRERNNGAAISWLLQNYMQEKTRNLLNLTFIIQEILTWVLPEDDGPTSSVTYPSRKPPCRRTSTLVKRNSSPPWVRCILYDHYTMIQQCWGTFRTLSIECPC